MHDIPSGEGEVRLQFCSWKVAKNHPGFVRYSKKVEKFRKNQEYIIALDLTFGPFYLHNFFHYSFCMEIFFHILRNVKRMGLINHSLSKPDNLRKWFSAKLFPQVNLV